ncbi:MAG TPA: methionine gamma-lyase [Oceanospirillales bacterium]|nr:methionine gamma-lyase [Oceanospirillales bacterium]
MKKNAKFQTRAIHFGYDAKQFHGALNPPVYMTSTFAFDSVQQGAMAFEGENNHYIYSRLGTPTQSLLEQRMANLENGEAALATASGMGAITSTLWSLLEPGDEIIADTTLYGCTFSFLQHGLKKFGITVTFCDLTKPNNLAMRISNKTKVVYGESPANPNMRLLDIAALAKISKKFDCKLIIDNTYCTPYLQKPLDLGADLVVHSATKYLGGHGDLIAGLVIGDAEILETIRYFGLKDMTGSVISAMDISLILRGLKTLHVRMDRHCSNAMKVANYLNDHPYVSKVFYPGLTDFEQYELAGKQMSQAGGMIAFEIKGDRSAGESFVNQLNMILCAVSLGDTETLIQHPASMTHSTYTEEELQQHLISPSLLRLSVGLEDVDDIIQDLEQALAKVSANVLRLKNNAA